MTAPRDLWRLAMAVLLAVALAAPLAACGKKASLDDPKEEKIPYPRQYPG